MSIGAQAMSESDDRGTIRNRQNRAPSYDELRPLKKTGKTFPVYEDLVEKLVEVPRAAYYTVAAHVCAVTAGWAYSDAHTAVSMAVRLGLERNWYREVSIYNDAMFIASNALLIQSKCGRVAILCYRGTEPRNFINWLTDADVNPVQFPVALGGAAEALVHGGSYRNLRATWHEVVAALMRAVNGKPVFEAADDRLQPLEALYITGHSLGAAMAAIAGVRLARDPVYERFGKLLRGVYTFGQPLVGNPAFAAACDADDFLSSGVFRHVYAQDVVPHLPPTAAGAFQHFGKERRANPNERWKETSLRSTQVRDIILSVLVIPILAFCGKQLEKLRWMRFPYSWYDHSPTFYISASTPVDVSSEFER